MKIECTGLRETIKRLERLKKEVNTDLLHRILQRLAEDGIEIADAGYRVAPYPGENDVTVNTIWSADGNTVYIVASGFSTMFIEFGSGVLHTSEGHPWASEIPNVVPYGTYGRGQGANEHGWIYKGEQGSGGYAVPVVAHRKDGTDVVRDGVYRTWGSPPARVMYNTVNQLRDEADAIIKEVLAET